MSRGSSGASRYWTINGADNMKAPRNGAFAGDGAELSGPQELWAQFWVPQFPWFQEQLRVELVQALPT